MVTKLGRLARSLRDAEDIVDAFTPRDVKLVIGGSEHDPADPVGRLLFTVLAMVAKFESVYRAIQRSGDLACWGYRGAVTTSNDRLGGGDCGGEPVVWSPADSAGRISVPGRDDDKYSRGVLGVITGSARYPGAAVIGVEAALRTGVGMVRYLGDPHPSELVLRARPEAVTADGRVQAWLIGSGMDAADRDDATADRIHAALGQGVPVVLDGGALDLYAEARGPVIITPHYRELARLLDADAAAVAADPATWASRAAADLGVTVLLKGHTTHVVGPGVHLVARSGTPWLATAGSGDALGGILGALVATHSVQIAEDPAELARLGATAAVLHGLAAARASGGGPFVVLDLAAALPATIAHLIGGRP